MLPEIKAGRKTGEEPIKAPDGQTIAKLLDFWQWAHSDLVGNTERGAIAEYLVACALGIRGGTRIPWDRYDLVSPEGIAIEVKASGYLQTWEQEKPSAIKFGIQPTYGWENSTGRYKEEPKRQSDVYVFCVHKHRDPETVDPLDVGQWDFYLMATERLNERAGDQKTASLSALIKMGARKCTFDELHQQITMLNRSNNVQ